MKKGFTLVELLAVIVILAIILAIAVPGISSIIESSQINAFKSNERMMLKAAKTYIEVNDNGLPVNTGDTTEISLETLKANNYISTITAPDDKTRDCSGYVIITKIDNSNYDYTPHLNCQSDIGSSSEDGLLAHYKFDDFQESTINMVSSPEFSSTSLGSGWGSWEPSVLTFGSINLLGKQTNYTNITKRTSGSTNAIHQAISGLTIGKQYTLSFYVRINPNASASTGYIKAYTNSYVDYSITKEWSRVVLTQTATSTSHTIHITQYSASYDVQVSYVQFEEKSYPTNFINGTRNGMVKDYSGNGHHGTILLTNSPTWIKDGKLGGAYSFNGVDNFFDVGTTGSLGLTDTHTISAWVKFDNTGGVRVGNIIGNYNVIPHFNFEGLTYGIRFYWNSGELDLKGAKDLRNNWHHVVVVRDKPINKIKIYVDGEKEVEGTAGTNRDIQWPLRVGGDFRDTPGIPFHGDIDDIRIYNRALSEKEVEQLYNLSK